MTLFDYIQLTENRISILKQGRSKRALAIGFDAKAASQKRIQERGEKFDGSPFAPYSPYYEKKRRKDGYQTAYVDYTQTGQMFKGITAEILKEGDYFTEVQITGRNSDTISKLINLSKIKKRGNPVKLSKREVQDLQDTYIELLRKDLNI